MEAGRILHAAATYMGVSFTPQGNDPPPPPNPRQRWFEVKYSSARSSTQLMILMLPNLFAALFVCMYVSVFTHEIRHFVLCSSSFRCFCRSVFLSFFLLLFVFNISGWRLFFIVIISLCLCFAVFIRYFGVCCSVLADCLQEALQIGEQGMPFQVPVQGKTKTKHDQSTTKQRKKDKRKRDCHSAHRRWKKTRYGWSMGT